MTLASTASRASVASPAGVVRRHWLAACLFAVMASRAAGEPAASAPRIRFRSRRAVCDCGSDLDDEAIERAMAERSARAASAPAADGQASDERKSKSGPTTTRRPAP